MTKALICNRYSGLNHLSFIYMKCLNDTLPKVLPFLGVIQQMKINNDFYNCHDPRDLQLRKFYA